jgi:glycerophosphoryl diester phosphodiesterase
MTMICAHRGASIELPDNSLAAFAAAIETGCEAIETDVRRGPDGDLVLAHDREDADRPEAVPLAELLDLARGRIGLDLELKEAGLETELLAAVEQQGGWLLVTAFSPAVLRRVGELEPAVRTGLLVEAEIDPDGPDDAVAVGDAVAAARSCGAAALLVEDPLLSPGLVGEAAEGDLALWSWTVDDPARIDRLLADGDLEGLITDAPATAMGRRAAYASGADRLG